jgi:hypothetical protein
MIFSRLKAKLWWLSRRGRRWLVFTELASRKTTAEHTKPAKIPLRNPRNLRQKNSVNPCESVSLKSVSAGIGILPEGNEADFAVDDKAFDKARFTRKICRERITGRNLLCFLWQIKSV